jgi:hypothetical protein
MEKNIILKDSVNISDSKIRGVVVLEKEDGTVIFKKENMIVEGGRNYIKNLFFTKVSGGTENRKIYTLKFGTSTALTLVGDTDLKANVPAYTINTDSLQWKKLISTSGDTNPDPVVVGDYFYNTSDNELLIGTAGTPNATWEEALDYTTGDSFPTSSLTENDLFYNTELSNLYVYGKAMIVSVLSSPEIGIKVSAVLRGVDAQQSSISELGLFLNDTPTATMFSRLVFDGFPLTANSAYILSYYIYF